MGFKEKVEEIGKKVGDTALSIFKEESLWDLRKK